MFFKSKTSESRTPNADLCVFVCFAGFSQPAGMGLNVEVGAAPLSAERPSSIAEAQQPSPPAASDAPKEHSPMLPEPQTPRSPLDLSEGKSQRLTHTPQKCVSS